MSAEQLETSSNDARQIEVEQSKQRQERKAKLAKEEKEEWYELSENALKVVKKTRLKNGNVFSSYVGSAKKPEIRALINQKKVKIK